LTRQRFSIGHEVGHTLFPGYDSQVQCRKPRIRDWHDRKDLVEYLCDVAASEFLFPLNWFQADLDETDISAERILYLASRYKASPEAAVRRCIDLTPTPMAAVFLRWKLKPSELPLRSMPGQRSLPGMTAGGPVPKLRVEYAVCNDAFDMLGYHIPGNKSVDKRSTIQQAAEQNCCMDANREYIDLGAFSGWFSISALPQFTKEAAQGPAGSSHVIAVIQPSARRSSK
jgi:hypothetical protein